MRIITGVFKGRTLKTVRDLSVRPATERVRQTLFNMLTNRLDFDGLHVLDLFAGSGSLGFEALSRGAAHVTFIERDATALHFLEENARSLGCMESVEILQLDAVAFIDGAQKPFGLIFADPPYAFPDTETLPGKIIAAGLLEQHGYLLIEHSSSLRFESTDRYTAGPEKKFGRTIVTFFQHREQGS